MSKEKKDTPAILLYPPVLMAVFLVVALLFGWKLPVPLPFPRWMNLTGWAVVLVGFGIGFGALRVMRGAGTSPNPRIPVMMLVTSGPFKISRNPIYLAYVLFTAGLPLVLGTYWGLLLCPVLLDAYNRLIIAQEEDYLEHKFGSLYLEYKARVRRWL
jgi:protein-S-isoprenylcysteine O-methyltransferase Ste14